MTTSEEITVRMDKIQEYNKGYDAGTADARKELEKLNTGKRLEHAKAFADALKVKIMQEGNVRDIAFIGKAMDEILDGYRKEDGFSW
ncbi:MAG: hypothetical protein KBT03_04670 [Bacteroidales bacterium]|nr:hypothetical protein [Candidatus Scybalousia scybalohippi]